MTSARVKNATRIGKGYSLGEIKAVGLSRSAVRELKIKVDKRRSTSHDDNVGKLKELSKNYKPPEKGKKKVAKAKPKAKPTAKPKAQPKAKPPTKPATKAKPKAKPKTVKKVKQVPLSDISGLGPKTAEKLEAAGIKSALDLAGKDPEKLSAKSGVAVSSIKKFVKEAEKLK